jgi:hypothetical protein
MSTADISKILSIILVAFALSTAETKSQAVRTEQQLPAQTYNSPDGRFLLQTFLSTEGLPVNQVDYVDKATGKRTPITLDYLLQRAPLFSDDHNGFVLIEGTSSMGSWPLFYKRDAAGGVVKLGPTLSDDGSPDKLINNIAGLIPKVRDASRVWISVKHWSGGPEAEIEISATTGGIAQTSSLRLDIPQDSVTADGH